MTERLDLALPGWAKGVLVIADVHGQAALFAALVALAQAEQRFIVSLGDLVDRGPDNAGALRQMLGLLDNGRGLFIRGNHDDKLHRTLAGNPTVVDTDLADTLAALRGADDGGALQRRFAQAYRSAPFLVRLGHTVMVHGAMRPAMLRCRTLPKKFQALALYGEATLDPIRKKPLRTYRWLDTVPAGVTVVIGHHPISDEAVLVRENPQGGRIIHLDCGAGKGRGLAAMRLDPTGAIGEACRAIHGEDDRIAIVPTAFAPVSGLAEELDIG